MGDLFNHAFNDPQIWGVMTRAFAVALLAVGHASAATTVLCTIAGSV
ncbi:MAG: hypothetical protein ACJAVR_001848 [Paracoccaceae bacterium]|jgi:hypothetical protein